MTKGNNESIKIPGTKVCGRCKTRKPVNQFHRWGRGRGLQSYCLECTKSYARKHRHKRKRNSSLQNQFNKRKQATRIERSYGITDRQYKEMLMEQHGGCAICGDVPKPNRKLDVDHNHVTGRVRGLLCGRCNIGLGYFRDDDLILEEAARYLYERDNRVGLEIA